MGRWPQIKWKVDAGGPIKVSDQPIEGVTSGKNIVVAIASRTPPDGFLCVFRINSVDSTLGRIFYILHPASGIIMEFRRK